MKNIMAYIENDKVVISPNTPTDIELSEYPAYKNWDKLRSLGYVNCLLLGETRGQYLAWHLPENDLERLELEIATYDFYYEMSDDQRVWNDGVQKDGRIQALSQKVGKSIYTELWKKYVEKASAKYRNPQEFIERYTKGL